MNTKKPAPSPSQWAGKAYNWRGQQNTKGRDSLMKRLLKIAAVVIALLIVIALALPFLIDVNRFRPQIEAQASSALGRQVNVGSLSLSLISGSVVADDISIADDPA